jgi:uncharacterized protein YcfJ
MAELVPLRWPKVIVLMSLLLSALVSCSHPLTTREKATLAGGTIGAATGTVVGATFGAPGPGAAVGGAIGGAGGALVGNSILAQNQERDARQQHSQKQKAEQKRQRVGAKHPLLQRPPTKSNELKYEQESRERTQP